MENIEDRIKTVEKEIRETPYHKGTEHHIGKLRARLAILKAKISEGGGKKGGGGGGEGFAVKKHGDATVVLVGFPSVGKSTLLNNLTSAHSRTAAYAFTTVSVIPGMMDYNGAKIQILDVPGLIEGAAAGRGRGREILSVIRSADLLLIVVEAGKESDFDRIEKELYENGVRLNREPPNIDVKKTLKGGIRIVSTIKQDLDQDTIKEICREFRISNAEIFIKERITLDTLIDACVGNRVFVKSLRVLNKVDRFGASYEPKKEAVLISAEKGMGLENLKESIWQALEFVRIYLKKPGGNIDYNNPLIVKKQNALFDVLNKLGPDFREGKKEAKIWGTGARFPGQTVSLTTKIEDKMEIMFL